MNLEKLTQRAQVHWDCAVAYTKQHPDIVLATALLCFVGWMVAGLLVVIT